jgi:hypothetical protein
MSSTVTRAQLIFGFTAVEDHGGAPSGVVIDSPFTAFNATLALLPTTTPPVALLAVYKTTIAGGGYTIDLSAAQGSNGTIDATGKRVQALRVSNPSGSTGDVTVATGASNGISLPSSVVVPPGGEALIYYADVGADIDGTHKTLDVSGTDDDVPEVGILLG